MKYTPIIGLEVHVELKTLSKMFCGCANDWFGEKPNTRTCPVCLGLPGALPVPNRKAIESCIRIGLALNCEIPFLSKFDRKNYFYPDLAKGYQISQYDQPFAEKGWLLLSTGKKIGITRAHMEEDTGKLLHETINNQHVSLIDFNRSGVPLVEIVTEPDFTSVQEVKEYLQKLQQIVRYLGVSRADMEKGEMRLEPNISLREISVKGEALTVKNLPKYKVEVKNINSFGFVEKAIAYEIERQAEILDKGARPMQETRGWDEDKKVTISQRNKEDAAEYRYFPEPDIPPFVWDKKYIQQLKDSLPEMSDETKERFIKTYGISAYNAELLTRTKELADYFEDCLNALQNTKYQIPNTAVANWIINKKIHINDVLPAQLLQQIVASQQVSGISGKELHDVLKTVIETHSQSAQDYKAGKTNALMFLVGQVMKELKGKVKAEVVTSELEKLLQK